MKFVHIADMHFDSPFINLSQRELFGDLRRLEQRKVLKKIIEYIKENNIKYLFISGDLYENQYVKQSTIEYINDLFLEIPDTKIFISPGNHDPYLKNSYYNKYNWSENVKIFNSKIEKVETESEKLAKQAQIKLLTSSIARREKLLSNENYINKAPKNIVELDRQKLEEEKKKLEALLK